MKSHQTGMLSQEKKNVPLFRASRKEGHVMGKYMSCCQWELSSILQSVISAYHDLFRENPSCLLIVLGLISVASVDDPMCVSGFFGQGTGVI